MKYKLEKLKQSLSNIYEIEKTEWAYAKTMFEYREFKRKELLTQQNFVENHIYFILDGIVRIYFDFEDKTHTLFFYSKDCFVTSYTSFMKRKPSEYNIEAVTDCKVLAISYWKFIDILKKTNFGNYLVIEIVEQNLSYLEKKQTNMLTKTPSERYLELIKDYPHILEKIPIKYVASYLGITAQAMSRIRKKILFLIKD